MVGREEVGRKVRPGNHLHHPVLRHLAWPDERPRYLCYQRRKCIFGTTIPVLELTMPQAFAGLQSNLGPGQTINNLHCVQRAVNEGVTAQTGIDSYNTCLARTSYPDFHSCVEFT